MAHLIDKDALVAWEKETYLCENASAIRKVCYKQLVEHLDTLEVKEVNEVPATVMVNKYGNRFIFSWSGLEEYDDLKKGEEIKILIPKK